jgi:hypothetical protein
MTSSPASRVGSDLLADQLLLDTHVFIWWRENRPRLGADARHRIAHLRSAAAATDSESVHDFAGQATAAARTAMLTKGPGSLAWSL